MLRVFRTEPSPPDIVPDACASCLPKQNVLVAKTSAGASRGPTVNSQQMHSVYFASEPFQKAPFCWWAPRRGLFPTPASCRVADARCPAHHPWVLWASEVPTLGCRCTQGLLANPLAFPICFSGACRPHQHRGRRSPSILLVPASQRDLLHPRGGQ